MSLDKLKKGDRVILHMFTGIAVNCTEIVACTDKALTIEKKDGTKVKFSRKTGKQIEPKAKNDRFANYITEDDGSYDDSYRRKDSKKKANKADDKKVKKGKSKPVDEDEDDEDEPEVKPKAKKSKAKKKPDPDEDEEIDEEEYEEE